MVIDFGLLIAQRSAASFKVAVEGPRNRIENWSFVTVVPDDRDLASRMAKAMPVVASTANSALKELISGVKPFAARLESCLSNHPFLTVEDP
jgi:hypothetical protein